MMPSTLHTTYAGMLLANPLIVSSSGLTDSPEKNRKLAEAGAGAIVLKSLFEEQIMHEIGKADHTFHPEAGDYMAAYIRAHHLGEYLTLIKESKKVCRDVPIIASINCYEDAEWIDFARQIEQAGADALEINILAHQTDAHYTYGSFEQTHIDILKHVRGTVEMPVIMKLGDNLTNPVALISQLQANGAAAVVLFNRFFQPDINIDTLTQTAGPVFSTEADLPKALRWIGIASAAVNKLDFAASGGVHSPEAVVKALLAGASAVQMCSVLYQTSSEFIRTCLQFLEKWMQAKGMESIADFKGRLNLSAAKDINEFERAQFASCFAMHQ